SWLKPRLARLLEHEAVVLVLVGAGLSIIVLEATMALDFRFFLRWSLRTLVMGGAAGALAGGALIPLFKGTQLPPGRRSAVLVISATAVFALTDVMQPNAGLVAMIVMGVFLAMQRVSPIGDVSGLDNILQSAVLPSIFLVLAARLRINDLERFDVPSGVFLMVTMLIARPVAVGLAPLGDVAVSWRQRLALSSVAPRGMLAAGLVYVFLPRLRAVDHLQSAEVLALTIAAVGVTTLVSSLAALAIRRWSEEEPAALRTPATDYGLGKNRLET